MSRKPRKPRLRIRSLLALARKSLPDHLAGSVVDIYCAWAARLTSEERRLRLLAGDRANHPDVVRHLVRRSAELRLSDTEEALRLAHAAVDVADCLKLPAEAQPLLMDIRAEALGALANSLRLAGKLSEAEDRWGQVASCLAGGTGDALLRADLDRMRGVLWTDMRRFDKAIPLLQQAAQDALEVGERHLAEGIRSQLARALNRAGQSEEALEINELAIRGLDPAEDPDLAFTLLHNTLICLEATGQEAEALGGLKTAEGIYRVFATPETWVRYYWMRGRLQNTIGEWRAAISDLEQAKKGFLSRGLEYDACFVSLELALAYAHLHDLKKVRHLAEEMLPVFEALHLPNEAAAVLLTFARAAESLRVSATHLAELAAQLRPLRLAYERGEPWAAPGLAEN